MLRVRPEVAEAIREGAVRSGLTQAQFIAVCVVAHSSNVLELTAAERKRIRDNILKDILKKEGDDAS